MTSRWSAPIRERRAVLAVWLAALAVAVPHGVAAEPADARARADALLSEGNAAMARDDVAAAAARYRAAWELAPEPRIALNLGIALAELGQTAGAAEAFAIYVADPAADPTKRPVLEERLQLWRPQLGEIVLDVTPPSANVAIDGVAPLRSGPGTRVPVMPGSHRVTAVAVGQQTGELLVVVAAKQRAIARMALSPAARVAEPVRGEPARQAERVERVDRGEVVDARPWKWIALGVGAAAAAVGTYYGVAAIDGWNDVEDRCPQDVCSSPGDLARATEARRNGTRANVAFGVTGAALIAAALLWRFEPGRRSWFSGVSVTPHNAGSLLCIAGQL